MKISGILIGRLIKKLLMTAVLVVIIAVSLCACGSKADVSKLLSFSSGAPEYDVELAFGGYKYPMRLSLEAEPANGGARNCRAKLCDGVLDGIEFLMSGGNISMKSGEYEFALDPKESPAMYALFGAFALDESDFSGVVSDKESNTYTARFENDAIYEIALDGESYAPLRMKIIAADAEYDVFFGSGAPRSEI